MCFSPFDRHKERCGHDTGSTVPPFREHRIGCRALDPVAGAQQVHQGKRNRDGDRRDDDRVARDTQPDSAERPGLAHRHERREQQRDNEHEPRAQEYLRDRSGSIGDDRLDPVTAACKGLGEETSRKTAS